MKILFASDLGFRGLDTYIGDKAVENMFADLIPVLNDADFRMVNLETPFSGGNAPIVKDGPNISALDDFIYALRVMNIDLVGLANNHTGDFGVDGVLYTLDMLDKNGYPHVGAGKNIEEAYKPYVLSKGGVNVSVLAVCENEFGTASKNSPGSAGYRLGKVCNCIAAEKEKGNYVVVYFHGGNEENPYPSPAKQELYRLFADIGANAVVAMHTHCPQGYEIYKGKPIIYSMGNFFFHPKKTPTDEDLKKAYYYGYMTMLDFEDGKVSYKLFPYHYNTEKMELLKGERLEKFMKHMEEITAPIHDEDELLRYFEGWSLLGGAVYAARTKFEPTMIDDSELVKQVKNVFSCEAHNEVVKAYLKLCYDGETKRAEKYKQKICEKQIIGV